MNENYQFMIFKLKKYLWREKHSSLLLLFYANDYPPFSVQSFFTSMKIYLIRLIKTKWQHQGMQKPKFDMHSVWSTSAASVSSSSSIIIFILKRRLRRQKKSKKNSFRSASFVYYNSSTNRKKNPLKSAPQK